MTGVRLATLGLLAVALVGLWKAWSLERWSFEGPGPGLFPSLVALTCVVLAVVVLIAPGRSTQASDEPEAAPSGRDTRKTFTWTALALVVLAIGPQFAGFALTTLMVSMLVLRFAEGRSWRLALGYGCAAALIGLVLFGGLLRVDLPVSALDRAVLTLVR
jgi:putative tricarboxylic transport membrane protein